MGYNENDIEQQLVGQIPEATADPLDGTGKPAEPLRAKQEEAPKEESMIGKKINVGSMMKRIDDSEFDNAGKLGASRLGESINVNAEIREGWMEVDKRLLGERATFYPDDWEFRIRPATVEAIRHWSTIDDENMNSVDRVFNEILKSCFAIVTANGPIPWYNINAWDRFFFILLIREYTFVKGESVIEYTEDCINCDNPVQFKLTSDALLYEFPDEEVMPMFDKASRNWIIDPTEYGLEMDPIRLYLPTLEKDINVKQWAINRYQENPNKDIDPVLIKFLPWFLPKISKDDTIAQRQIKEFKRKFESWDIDTFNFMNDVITNVMVTPGTKLIQTCPTCGEEVTSLIRFPDGPSSLFHIKSKFKKFGKK
jgi:hypothetical protein